MSGLGKNNVVGVAGWGGYRVNIVKGDMMTAIPKARVWQSEKYRRFVASLECCVPTTTHSSRETVIPHHTEGGGRRKRDDLTIPVCKFHHDIYHDLSRKGFEKKYGVWVDDLIVATQALRCGEWL